MHLSASEQATQHFYLWEYRGRCTHVFNTPVNIEPPYIPFHHDYYTYTPPIDDGRVPSLLDRLGTLLAPKEKEMVEVIENDLVPNYINDLISLTGFSFSFPQGQEIQAVISEEFLTMLSYTDNPVSFEILGNSEHITIQIICSKNDESRVSAHLKAYFPSVIMKTIDPQELGFSEHSDIAIRDFGLSHEFMRPIGITQSFSIDPLTSIIATFDTLQTGDTAVFQIIFKGVTAPWSKSILNAVSDGGGGAFFSDAPEMLPCAIEKVSNPLFSVVMRIATQGNTKNRSQYLATELERSISNISRGQHNNLVALSNDGYTYDFHSYNLYNRLSNRLGFILNTKELTTFVHYPNKTVVSAKLYSEHGRAKSLPSECINQKYVLGINDHDGIETKITLNDRQRLQHCHILGVTGVGKSTLIANMMLEDMKNGNGCVLFDPHGDISDDVLLRIPKHRVDDVIIIDPSDTDFPIGFNLLEAKSDAERIVLSSDLVSAFKRYATSWGDNMTAVLSNVINTFLESSRGGTLIELKRFLIEERFRDTYLKSVDDQSILYYWKHEYPMLRKGIAPLLTRIDTFLRPKIIRYMFAQRDGIDFKEAVENKKIIIIKLSLGLIGEDNSYLLGSLFLSKINQVAHSRQSLPKNERHPYYVYLDEFHNFITPSITSMLSGARKYGIGLTLAHQELGQIEDTKILNSVISNPHIRICFRLGDNDAKKLDSGFSFFEQADLQSLNVGKALMRVGSSTSDCNIQTFPLVEVDSEVAEIQRTYIVEQTQKKYGKPRAEVERILENLLPRITSKKKIVKNEEVEKIIQTIEKVQEVTPTIEITEPSKEDISKTDIETKKETYLKQATEQENTRKHRSIQNFIRTMAQQRGFNARTEEETKDGGRVDVGLTKNDIRIAVEVSVTNSIAYEVKNLQKCIDNQYDLIYLVSESELHRKNIEKETKKTIEKKHISKLFFIPPSELAHHLDIIDTKDEKPVKRVKGWRVNVNFHVDDTDKQKENSLSSKILKVLRNKK